MTRLIQEGPFTACFNRYYSALVDSGSVMNYKCAIAADWQEVQNAGRYMHMSASL